MFHLNDKIDFNSIKIAPWLSKVPLETCTTHRQSVIEKNQLVTVTSFGGDIPAFQGSAVIRWEIDVSPSSHPIIVRRLMEYASERLDDGGYGLDLRVIFFGNGLELCQGLFILSLDILLMISPHAMFSFGGRSYEPDQETGCLHGGDVR
jgi:hypothetical protein